MEPLCYVLGGVYQGCCADLHGDVADGVNRLSNWLTNNYYNNWDHYEYYNNWDHYEKKEKYDIK